jgi:hypothetical protein
VAQGERLASQTRLLSSLRESREDDLALIVLFAGMAESASIAAERLEEVMRSQRAYRATLEPADPQTRLIAAVLDASLEIAQTVARGLREVAAADVITPPGRRAGIVRALAVT